MQRTLWRLLPLAAIALAFNACRFGYGLLDADGAISAGDGGQAPAIAGAAGSAGSLVSGGSGGAPSTGMGGTDDAAGAPAEIGGASGMNGLGGSSGSGASSGNAGSGGSSGNAGSSGSSGNAGSSGSGGKAGSSGSGGSGGKAGSGGKGGASGSAGSGVGGSGGIVNLIVTTAADEADSAATPASPGQTGFSLREAIAFANGNSGHQSISFAAAVASIGLKSPLPTVQETLDIQGPVILDASTTASSSACLAVASSNVHIDSLEIHDCQGEPVLFSSSASSGNQLLNSYLHDNQKAAVVYGDGAVVSGNLITFSAASGLEIFGKNAQLLSNDVAASLATNYLIHDGANGAYLLANVSIGGGDGIGLGAVTGITIWHSTVVDSVYAGLNVGSATQVDARNNIFIGADTYGVQGPDSAFSKLDHNLYLNNTSGNRSQGSLDATSIIGDPLFNDATNFDYSLKVGSAAINKGFNLGVDRNQAAAGLYNGSAPDIGWVEAP